MLVRTFTFLELTVQADLDMRETGSEMQLDFSDVLSLESNAKLVVAVLCWPGCCRLGIDTVACFLPTHFLYRFTSYLEILLFLVAAF